MSDCDPNCRHCHPPEVRCDKCGEVIPYMERWGNLDRGMRVTFEGWYGGTIDPFFPQEVTLCDADARAFLTANPWLVNVSQDLTPPPEKVNA